MTRYYAALALIFVANVPTSLRSAAYACGGPQWYFGLEQTVASDLTTAPEIENPGRPSVAFDGTNHLLITDRMLNNSNTLLGVLVSREGAAIKSFEVAQTTPHYQTPYPAVAFGSSNYLVAFLSEGAIRGIRISTEGLLLDAPGGFQVSAEDRLSSSGLPAIASDGERFLVVWQKYGYASSKQQIRGAFVDGSGGVSPEFAIGQSNWQVHASVAFGKDQYLVVWEDNRWGDLDLVATRVTGSGVVLDPEGFQVCRAPQDQLRPHVTFGGTNFFVVWQDEREAGYQEPQIYGTRITSDAVVLDGPNGRPISTVFPAEAPRAAYDGARYFVTWMLHAYYENDPRAGIYIARIDQNGELVDGSDPTDAGIRLSAVTRERHIVYPEVSFDGSKYLVSYLLNWQLAGPLKAILSRVVGRRGVLGPPVMGNDGCIELPFENDLGKAFVLERSEDLSLWKEMDMQSSSNGIVRFSDCSAPAGTNGFYRVREK